MDLRHERAGTYIIWRSSVLAYNLAMTLAATEACALVRYCSGLPLLLARLLAGHFS